jgi:hypothetical protein
MSVNIELTKRIEFKKKYKRLVIRDSGRINHLNSYKIHLEVAIRPRKTMRKKVISLRKSKKKLKFDYI